ncbi:MAG: hypothetical protein N3A38_12570, partial [Planctomycetota bacterium]|nr:hypothetical protein [Planctomycetota bacterium]
MDRREWLVLVYREANRFIERHETDKEKLDPERMEDLDEDLRNQLQQALISCDHLEDIIKHSLLKDPPPDIWRDEDRWERVLIGVAAECLLHDVKGIVLK